MILPEWTTFNVTYHILLAILVLGTGPAIYLGQSLSGYNKVRSGRVLPARLGMVFLYSSPIIALIFSARGYLANASPVQWTVFGAVFFHFMKRVLESLFLHKYSKPVGLASTLLIALFYSQAAYSIGWLNQNPIPATAPRFLLGIPFFFIGIAGNFYHHKLLADLRKDSFAYFIPRGGLFRYVVCPHYLFEITGWFGIALLSSHLAAWMNLLIMISFLTAQSLRALEWYRAEFADFPKDRKAILPFVL